MDPSQPNCCMNGEDAVPAKALVLSSLRLQRLSWNTVAPRQYMLLSIHWERLHMLERSLHRIANTY